MRGPASLVPLAAVVLGACSGPAELSLGSTGTPAMVDVFIAPDGTLNDRGTRERPLKTFEEALRRLRPGSTLTLLSGAYDGTNGPLKATCDDVNVFSGTGADKEHRIVIKADMERAAWLRGDGAHPPIELENCRFWTIEGLRVESRAAAPAPQAAEAGSVVVLRANDRDIILSHLLASAPNPNAHAHVVTIGPGCSDVLVEECELYDFHHNAVEATRAGRLTLRRNYLNSRNTRDAAWPSDDADRGDYGFLFEETHDVIAENNIVESVHAGFGVLGRDTAFDGPAESPVANNRLLGNIVLGPLGVGVRIDSRCQAQNPCPTARTVIDTEIANDIIFGGAAGISNAGAVNTRIQQVTILNAANGVLAAKEQNVAIRSTWSTINTLAVVQNTAFKAGADEAQWVFDRCAAASSNPDALFVIANGNANGSVKDTLPVPPGLDACSPGMPPASLGGRTVGANVLDQYKDGVLMPGVPLWSPGTAAFIGCGAVIDGANGDNGDPNRASCEGLPQRLRAAACAVP